MNVEGMENVLDGGVVELEGAVTVLIGVAHAAVGPQRLDHLRHLRRPVVEALQQRHLFRVLLRQTPSQHVSSKSNEKKNML